jgi:hypothetical protein
MGSPSRSTLALGALAICIALPLTGCLGRDLAGGGAALTGDPFSADLVDPVHPDKPATRIYFGNGKVRIQSSDASGFGALVLDPAKGTTLVIDDKPKQYVDAGMFSRLVMVGAGPALQVLRPAGSGDPCSQWNSAVSPFAKYAKRDDSKPAPVFTCKSLGSESVNGRAAHKWEVTTNDPDDKGGTIWIDDRLHIMARTQGDNGAMEIRNIKEGPQPEALFEAPAGYKKISVTSILGDIMKGGNDSASGKK